MTEPAVALTDFGLAVECAIFVWLMLPLPSATDGTAVAHRWFSAFFAASGIASLLGGIVHGYFTTSSSAHTVLWQFTLAAVGLSALALSMIALALIERHRSTSARRAAGFLFLISLAATLAWPRFIVVMAAYLPAVLFLFVVLARRRRERHDAFSAWAMAGIAIMLMAAVVQQLGPRPFPASFNHNAIFHVIQSLALLALFGGAQQLTSSSRT